MSGTEHNHLANVLRLRVGDEITVVCGDEFDYFYAISSISKSQTNLSLVEKRLNTCNPKQNLTIYLAVIKFDNLAQAVTQLNEIGVTEVVIFKSANCQNVNVNLDKLQSIANQSCKQCHRSIPLKVSGIIPFEHLPKGAIFADIIPFERRRGGTRWASDGVVEASDVDALIIGPEGGFTDSERAMLREKATPISLGPRILRAETAAVVGASLMLSRLGEI